MNIVLNKLASLMCVFEILGASASEVNLPIGAEKNGTTYVFLNENCPIARHYTLTLKKLYGEFSGEGVEIVGVFSNENSTMESIREFQNEYDIPFSLRLDRGQAIADKFAVKIMPEVVVVDSAGSTVYQGRIDNSFVRPGRKRARPTKYELREALTALCTGRTPTVSRTKAIGCFIQFDSSKE